MKNYVDYVKDFIMENLPEYEGLECYACDLANYVYEGINADGTVTYSTQKAMDYIREWFDYAGDVYNYQVENYGKCLWNPFEYPEKFMVSMIIEGVNAIFCQCPLIDKEWNEEGFVLTEENIQTILDYVKEVDEIEF